MSDLKIRFKRDDGSDYPEWRTVSIGDILERQAVPINVDGNELYREIGIRSHGKGLFHKDPVTGEELGNKSVFEIIPDCLVLNIVFAWERAVAKTTSNEIGMIASHRFPMYKPKEGVLDLDYIVKYLITDKGKRLLELASPGGAGRNRTLGQKEFANSKISLPCYEEQKKIANLLVELDRIIELCEQEVVNLGKQKTFAMKKIFSQETSFRKADGGEFPEWEDRSLSYYLSESKERNKKAECGRDDVLSVSKDFGVVNQIDFFGKSLAGEDLTNYHRVHKGDVVYTKSPLGKQPYGIIKASEMEGIVSVLYAVYHCNNKVLPEFVDQYFSRDITLNNYLKPLVNIGAKHTMNVNNAIAISGLVRFPSSIIEQRAIVDFLSDFDETIVAAKKELDLWQKLKTGLLQQMFV